MPIKRTTMRSSKGTKLYAVRDSKGRFKDIQTYKRAHSMDIKRKSKAELAKAAKTKAKAKTVKVKAKTVSKPKAKKKK
jgi:DNA-binding protein HU-beta